MLNEAIEIYSSSYVGSSPSSSDFYPSNATIEIKSSGGGLSGSGELSANQIIVDQGGDTTYDGDVWMDGSSSSASSVARFIKRGSGSLKLSGNTVIENYNSSPQIILEGGVLEVDSNPLFVVGSTGLKNNSVFIFSGGTLKYGSALAGSPPDFSSRFTTDSGQTFRIDTNSANVSLSNAVGGISNSLEKLGSGSLLLMKSNTYGGETIVKSVPTN